MYHTPAPPTHYYRVTARGRRFPEVLSGKGAFHTPGGRYNAVHQKTVYASDDPLVSITEMAFYQALEWQRRIGGGRAATPRSANQVTAPRYPLVSAHVLWCFTLAPPPRVVDVEAPAALGSFGHDPILLQNPGQYYHMSRALADDIRVHFLGQPDPRGLKAPSARTPTSGGYQPEQYALFVSGRRPAGQFVWKADLSLEFLDPLGNQVAPTTRQVDWTHPRFQLSATALPIPAFTPRPGAQSYPPGRWHPIEIQA